jgi:hypothetical protein
MMRLVVSEQTYNELVSLLRLQSPPRKEASRHGDPIVIFEELHITPRVLHEAGA